MPLRPSLETTRAVLRARQNDHRAIGVLRGLVDRHDLTCGVVDGPPAFGARREFVSDANVGEGSAHHHFVVATPAAKGIEIALFDALLLQPASCRTALQDGSRRRNVVGGDRITELEQDASAVDGGDGRCLRPKPLEEGGQANVGGILCHGYSGEGSRRMLSQRGSLIASL